MSIEHSTDTVIFSTPTTMFSNELQSVNCTRSVRNLPKFHNLELMVGKLESRIARMQNLINKSAVVSDLSSIKTKKCQPDAGDRPDLIQTEPVPSTGLARQTNYLSKMSRVQVTKLSRVQVTKNTKTKKCQPDAGDRPDLIQTEACP